jgi:uncharacterized membrane protein (DUF106 family)
MIAHGLFLPTISLSLPFVLFRVRGAIVVVFVNVVVAFEFDMTRLSSLPHRSRLQSLPFLILAHRLTFYCL